MYCRSPVGTKLEDVSATRVGHEPLRVVRVRGVGYLYFYVYRYTFMSNHIDYTLLDYLSGPNLTTLRPRAFGMMPSESSVSVGSDQSTSESSLA